nr:hypothetical protein [uncultured Brevundimonas sp.]
MKRFAPAICSRYSASISRRRAVVHQRGGAGDGDVHIGELHRQILRPGFRLNLRLADGGPARRGPAFAEQVPQRPRRRSRQRRGRIMPGLGDPALAVASARVAVPVRARVPAVGQHVDAAAERQPVVDHHDLLVVRARRRVVAVQPGVDAFVAAPLDQGAQGVAPQHHLQQPDVPAQDEDL